MIIVIVVGTVDSVDKKIPAHRRDGCFCCSPYIGFNASFQTLSGVDKPWTESTLNPGQKDLSISWSNPYIGSQIWGSVLDGFQLIHRTSGRTIHRRDALSTVYAMLSTDWT